MVHASRQRLPHFRKAPLHLPPQVGFQDPAQPDHIRFLEQIRAKQTQPLVTPRQQTHQKAAELLQVVVAILQQIEERATVCAAAFRVSCQVAQRLANGIHIQRLHELRGAYANPRFAQPRQALHQRLLEGINGLHPQPSRRRQQLPAALPVALQSTRCQLPGGGFEGVSGLRLLRRA